MDACLPVAIDQALPHHHLAALQTAYFTPHPPLFNTNCSQSQCSPPPEYPSLLYIVHVFPASPLRLSTSRFDRTAMTKYHSKRHRQYDYDEPYMSLPRPKGVSAIPSSAQHGIQGWWVGGEWIIQPPLKNSRHEQRSRLSPIVVEDDEDSKQVEVPPPILQRPIAGQASQNAHFDFNNSDQAVPWARRPDGIICGKVRSPEYLVYGLKGP